MNRICLKKGMAYVLPIVLFLVISYAFVPQVLQGKRLRQDDIVAWEGMAKEARDYNNSHSEPTLWTNSLFGGMPTVTITMPAKGNALRPLAALLEAGKAPATYLFVSLLGGFLLFLSLGVAPFLAAAGAIGITFCSYNMQIIQVGHITKMVAIAYMPYVVAAFFFAYRKRPFLGAVLFAFAVGLEAKANHPQIAYYLCFLLLGLFIGLLVESVRKKTFPKFLKTTCLILVAGLLGLGTFANRLLPTAAYTAQTMRGGAEGLDTEYATQWCYGPAESINMLIPNAFGGSSVGALDRSSETFKVLQEGGYSATEIIKQLPLYWGPQPFTAGPMYMGAVLLFLFVLGLYLHKGPLKWATLAVMVLTLFLAWGAHFMPLTAFFFKYVPLYNKFRTVSMILVVWQIAVPLLGIVTVHQLLEGRYDPQRAKKAVRISALILAGFCLLLAIAPTLTGHFVSPADAQLPAFLRPALVADRMHLLRADALRSAAFILLSAGALEVYLRRAAKEKGTAQWVVAVLAVLLLVDFWGVDKRFLNHNHFITQRAYQNEHLARAVDQYILQDTTYYRVLDLTVSPFNDASVSYFHKSIGGYNAAKLQRYQDVIDVSLMPQIQALSAALNQCTTLEEAEEVFTCAPMLNMLNTKYLVINGDSMPLENAYALGNAWPVAQTLPAAPGKEALTQLASLDLKTQAVIDRRPHQWQDSPAVAEEDAVVLTSYAPNALEYHAHLSAEQTVVFSEVYYPDGWKAWIDNQEVPIYNANYIARALRIPAGDHTVRFAFELPQYRKGIAVSRACSWTLLALLAVSVFYACRRKKQTDSQK